MANKTPLTKQELKEKQRRLEEKARKKNLVERKDVAISNLRNRASILAGEYDDDYTPQKEGRGNNSQRNNDGQGVDRRFASDIQNAKFCRKPVGFLMSLIFLICIALIALPFVPMQLPSVVTQYTSLFAETEPKAAAVDTTDEEGDEEGDEETAAEAAANADTEEDATEADGDGEDAEESEEAATTSTATGTYYTFADPISGWIRFVFGKLGINVNLPLGDSPWYDAQISKVETGMEDTLAPLLLEIFPAAIILYAFFAFVMFIKTFICWASGDRRIFRRTWIECLVMLILALVVALGGYASTVDPLAKMEFGGIVNYLAGLITGTGGFTAGFGLLAMLGLPFIALILSFFLLEKKLRSRDVMQPIIMYDSKR